MRGWRSGGTGGDSILQKEGEVYLSTYLPSELGLHSVWLSGVRKTSGSSSSPQVTGKTLGWHSTPHDPKSSKLYPL